MSVKLFPNFEGQLSLLIPVLPKKIAVAVSGGADSLCLAHCVISWAKKHQIQVYTFTVNHGLRKEANQEARYVHQLTQQWGALHRTLLWTGKKPKTHIEEAARDARYHLLYQACQKAKIDYLCVAHHMEDQSETFWMRCAHGSGLDGLSAMDKKTSYQNLTILRPLLDYKKSEILTYNQHYHIQWCEDQMNQDNHFERVKWRQNQNTLNQMGLKVETIYTLTQRLQKIKDALTFYTDSFIKNHVFISPMGYAFIQHLAWDMIPNAIQVRVMQKILPIISGDDKIISLDGIEHLITDQRSNITFAGCLIIKNKNGYYITKEYRTPICPKIISAKKWTHWERFDIWSPKRTNISLGSNISFRNIPKAIQRNFPHILGNCFYSIDTTISCGIYVAGMPVFTQKELEKKVILDYNKSKDIVYIHFNPRKVK